MKNIHFTVKIICGLLVGVTLVSAQTLDFKLTVGSENNYFIQSSDGAFHVLAGKNPQTRVTIASPAGNSGAFLQFSGKKQPIFQQLPLISGREHVVMTLNNHESQILEHTVLGSIRLIRDYNALTYVPAAKDLAILESQIPIKNPLHATVAKWLNPHWQIADDGKTAILHIVALNNQDWYNLQLTTINGSKFSLIQVESANNYLPEKLAIPAGDLTISYSSSYAPLTPFALSDFLNSAALVAYNNLPAAKKQQVTVLLDSLRFLAYKEKFLAGSWRFLTYFGRDSLLSTRLLAPIVKPEVFAAVLHGMSTHLSPIGEISHEEDLGDQAFIDQIVKLGQNRQFTNLMPDFVSVTNNYNMVDENYLALPLILDYYQIGGRDIFNTNNPNYLPILLNMNYVLNQALSHDLLAIHDGSDVGDWRDSQVGLAHGRYSLAVNSGHIPAALTAIETLFKNKAWDRSALAQTATSYHLDAINKVLAKPQLLTDATTQWSSNWQKFQVSPSSNEQIRALNNHRQFLGFPDYNGLAPYPQGFLALSLNQNREPIPVINSDSVFMLLDNRLSESALNVAVAPFTVNFPDGLSSSAGYLINSTALASENYYTMLDNNQYHGEVMWGWQQLMLNVALQKQLGQWITPPTSKLSTKERKTLQQLLKNSIALQTKLSAWQTSELWTWKNESGNIVPRAFGEGGGDSTSNADQLWSVAAVGDILWNCMSHKK